MPVEHFRSEEAYRKNMAYRHMHGVPMRAKEVCIGKKCHKVKHSVKRKSKRKSTRRKR